MKLTLSLLGIALLALVATGLGAPAASSDAQTGRVLVVQAVPGIAVDVSVDGKVVKCMTEVGAMVGPLTLTSGTHAIEFSGAPPATDGS